MVDREPGQTLLKKFEGRRCGPIWRGEQAFSTWQAGFERSESSGVLLSNAVPKRYNLFQLETAVRSEERSISQHGLWWPIVFSDGNTMRTLSSLSTPINGNTSAEAHISATVQAGGDMPARKAARRRISPVDGRALEILGHAIEYLADEYALSTAQIGVLSSADPRVEAIQMLMALNRQVYYACPEIEPLLRRIVRKLMPGSRRCSGAGSSRVAG
jgi:hypothetical protein